MMYTNSTYSAIIYWQYQIERGATSIDIAAHNSDSLPIHESVHAKVAYIIAVIIDCTSYSYTFISPE